MILAANKAIDNRCKLASAMNGGSLLNFRECLLFCGFAEDAANEIYEMWESKQESSDTTDMDQALEYIRDAARVNSAAEP